MTSEIPRDIEMVAFKIANGWSHNDEERADMQADIQRALLAERERCAKIASQRINRQLYANGDAPCFAAWHRGESLRTVNGLRWKDGPDIAAAIRQQATP